MASDSANKTVSEPRHSSRCGICSHPQRRTIEHAFLNKTMPVSEIRQKFGVGHDAVYRHAHALNLLPTRNRNWRAPVIPDNSAEVTTEAVEMERSERSVLHAEVESTPYARAMAEFLMLKPDDDLLTGIEEAIQAKARSSGLPIDLVASGIRITAALTKIKKQPDDWPSWFRNGVYDRET